MYRSQLNSPRQSMAEDQIRVIYQLHAKSTQTQNFPPNTQPTNPKIKKLSKKYTKILKAHLAWLEFKNIKKSDITIIFDDMVNNLSKRSGLSQADMQIFLGHIDSKKDSSDEGGSDTENEDEDDNDEDNVADNGEEEEGFDDAEDDGGDDNNNDFEDDDQDGQNGDQDDREEVDAEDIVRHMYDSNNPSGQNGREGEGEGEGGHGDVNGNYSLSLGSITDSEDEYRFKDDAEF